MPKAATQNVSNVPKKTLASKKVTVAETPAKVTPAKVTPVKKTTTCRKKKANKQKVDEVESVVDTPLISTPKKSTPKVEIKKQRKRQTPTRDTILSLFDELVEMIDGEIQRLKDGPVKTKGGKFLRSVNKLIKSLRSQTSRVIKKKTKNSHKSNKNSGFQKPVNISTELAKFAGWNEDELRSRTDVTKYICDYIAQNDLQNPKDRRLINLDSKLQKLFGYNPKKNKAYFRYCDIQSCLKKQNHFPKDEQK
jgi:chromatin remodeling complex protein RSC6